MFYITQLIYLKEGQEEIFDAFEAIAIPVISKYNGRLLIRLRPQADSFLMHDMERPYELHLVAFETVADFEAFKLDEYRRQFLHLKEQSIRSSLLIGGHILT